MDPHTWILSVPFEDKHAAAALGALWNAKTRAHTYTGLQLPDSLRIYASQPYSWERWREEDLNPTKPNLTNVGESFLTPRPHQVEAIVSILKAAKAGARGFLLADDVGVGKTLSAAVAVARMGTIRPVKHVLIVCPLAVVPHWRRTLSDIPTPANIRFCVINYDRLKHLLTTPASATQAKRRRTKNQRTARDGESLVNWDVVVFDESHQLKNMDAQRSMAAARIAKYHHPARESPFVLWMSATAGQNPTELSYLAPLLAQATGSKSSALKDFGPWLLGQGFHVVEDPRWKKWSWTLQTKDRASDIALMKKLLFARSVPIALRRRPTDIAGWPEVQRILLPVDLTVANRVQYLAAWTEFRRSMNLVQRGKNPTGGLVAQLRFRQKASLVRVLGTVEHALDLLANGHQVTISVQFIETLDAIRSELEKKKIVVAVMDGRSPKTREAERLRFQRGEAKVVLFTPVEGFSLHQDELLADGSEASNNPRSLIVHDPRYSGIQAIQIEGRQHRDSQNANAYYAFSTNTVEEKIVATLLDRMESTKALVGDDTSLIRDLERILGTTVNSTH